ncbi:MAG: AbrB family transcriptional regulator [Candidatus Thiodiazotropha endolucinida]|nr:AbrB family transcriptional regulator [Candidatus Thiodiazotropha taylori]
MPKVSEKRQITLTTEQCRMAGIKPGDEYQSFVNGKGSITIIKKSSGAARGILKRLKGDAKVSDEASLQSVLNR